MIVNAVKAQRRTSPGSLGVRQRQQREHTEYKQGFFHNEGFLTSRSRSSAKTKRGKTKTVLTGLLQPNRPKHFMRFYFPALI